MTLRRALECARERFEHALGDAREVAALQPRVVVDAHAGEQRDLLPSQTRHAPVLAVPQARLLGVILARLEVRNSLISVLVYTPVRVRPPDWFWGILPVPGSTRFLTRRRGVLECWTCEQQSCTACRRRPRREHVMIGPGRVPARHNVFQESGRHPLGDRRPRWHPVRAQHRDVHSALLQPRGHTRHLRLQHRSPPCVGGMTCERAKAADGSESGTTRGGRRAGTATRARGVARNRRAGLGAYEPEPGGQAYTAFVSWLVQGGSCAELAFLANLAAYGENCRRLAGMLKGRCDTSFFEFFATNSCSPRQALTRSRCARRRP